MTWVEEAKVGGREPSDGSRGSKSSRGEKSRCERPKVGVSAGPWDPKERRGGASEGEAGGEVRRVMGGSGGQEAAVGIWAFALGRMRNHWKVLSRAMTSSDLCSRRLFLAPVK